MEEYKGIFYNDNSEKKYYEGGAHFRYKDLVRELTFIKKQRESHTTSLSSLSTNDIKTQSPLKKSLIIHKLPNRKENSQERNVEQSSTRRVIYKNNQTNSINSYREKMPLINNNINSRNMTKQKKVSLNQIKTMNIEYNYFAHISNNSHIRNNSKEQIFFLKSSSLKSLVPIVNKTQRKNIVNQKSFLFNGFNQQLRSRNINFFFNNYLNNEKKIMTIILLYNIFIIYNILSRREMVNIINDNNDNYLYILNCSYISFILL